MATITNKVNNLSNNLGATPWGNLAALHFTLEANASGAMVNSDSTSAIALGDKVRVGRIPPGFKLVDSEVIISNAFSASVTAKIGFEYVDGVDSAKVPQDDDYFGAGLVLSSAARLRNATANEPVTLPKEAWLIVTTAGAANAKAAKLDALIFGVPEGVL